MSAMNPTISEAIQLRRVAETPCEEAAER